VSVTQRGGVFGVDQVTEVHDSVARLLDKGEVTAERKLAKGTATTIARLVDRYTAVKREAPPSVGHVSESNVADSMATTIEIEGDTGESHEVAFASGDEMPPELSQLVEAVLKAPYRDPTPAPRRRSGAAERRTSAT
jgi:hypothetical protein